jgi:hypothetical protein
MKNKKITQVRFHIGINVAGQVLTSIDEQRDKAKMELLPVGVHFSVRGEERIVPFSNVLQISVVEQK